MKMHVYCVTVSLTKVFILLGIMCVFCKKIRFSRLAHIRCRFCELFCVTHFWVSWQLCHEIYGFPWQLCHEIFGFRDTYVTKFLGIVTTISRIFGYRDNYVTIPWNLWHKPRNFVTQLSRTAEVSWHKCHETQKFRDTIVTKPTVVMCLMFQLICV